MVVEQVSGFENTKHAHRTLRTLALAVLVLLLSGCDLETGAIAPWDTGSTAFVCPVTRRRCSGTPAAPAVLGAGVTEINVNIVSMPPSALSGGHATSISGRSSISSLPITGVTTFTFSGNVGRAEFGPYENTTDVLLPDRVTTVPTTLAGTCTGWETVSLAAGDFRSEGVRVVSITEREFVRHRSARLHVGDRAANFRPAAGRINP